MKALIAIFWLHNFIFAFASFGPIWEILATGGTRGQINLIALVLAWIAGALMWGLGAISVGVLPKPDDAPRLFTETTTA